MTAEDARCGDVTWLRIPAGTDEHLVDHSLVPGDPHAVQGSEVVGGHTRGRLPHGHTPDAESTDGLWSTRSRPAGESPVPTPRRPLGGRDATTAQEPADRAAGTEHLLLDRYAAERDQARADLAKVRRLIERHITTHGYYADRRLKAWYDATATPRTPR